VQPGSVALVLADGTIEGFVGGSCTEHSIRAYSLAALQDDEPVLLRIVGDLEAPAEADAEQSEGIEVGSEDGVVTVNNPCLSGGTIEVFLEPVPRAPRVLVVGETPIAAALLRIGAELGLEMVAAGADGPEPGGGDLALIVAAHGRDELHVLRQGLDSDLPYVGLIASERRGIGVLEELRTDGVPEELLRRIDVPAGVPIGSRTAAEIAVSVLAGVVSVRRGGPRGPAPATGGSGSARGSDAATAGPPSAAPLAVDPICGMTVAAVAGTPSLEHQDETVYFCCDGCKAKFEAQTGHASIAG
jgi:xanthine dehydrogenase accessory factor